MGGNFNRNANAMNCHDDGRAAWMRRGEQLARTLGETKWALGDWAAAAAWGDLAGVADAIGIAYGTLRNLASVAARFPAGRRRAGLTWSHHAEAERRRRRRKGQEGQDGRPAPSCLMRGCAEAAAVVE